MADSCICFITKEFEEFVKINEFLKGTLESLIIES